MDKFIRLGECQDTSPGEAFDKAARDLLLHSREDLMDVSGGQAVETVAGEGGDPLAFEFPVSRHRNR